MIKALTVKILTYTWVSVCVSSKQLSSVVLTGWPWTIGEAVSLKLCKIRSSDQLLSFYRLTSGIYRATEDNWNIFHSQFVRNSGSSERCVSGCHFLKNTVWVEIKITISVDNCSNKRAKVLFFFTWIAVLIHIIISTRVFKKLMSFCQIAKQKLGTRKINGSRKFW